MGHHPVEDSNRSNNRAFDDIIQARFSRRRLLTGTASAATVGVLGSMALVGCGGSSNSSSDAIVEPSDQATMNPQSLGFEAVPGGIEDRVILPPGYKADVLFAKGDPLFSGLPSFKNDGTDIDYDSRSGDEHDGMHFFGMNSAGQFDPDVSDRGILVLNHENLEDNTLHETPTSKADAISNGNLLELKKIVDREMNGHGVSCVEIRKQNGKWSVVLDSPYNRRLTIFTEMDMRGPVAGEDFVKTKLTPTGANRYGTMNNCANGHTPWGTYLAAEENWYAYYTVGDIAGLSDKHRAWMERYGIRGNGWNYRQWNLIPGDQYERFRVETTGGSATTDFRNEPNLHGYITEVDPFRPTQKPRIRTTFGRLSHEGAWLAPVKEGKPVVFYSGDDARREYMYKFVSKHNWNEADRNGGLAAGDRYMDEGKLYVAVFNDDGTGVWKELSHDNIELSGTHTYTRNDNSWDYTFDTEAEVLASARLAADVVGATPMDRPEWATVNPQNGDVYLALTNGNTSNRPASSTDGANPRAINQNGHIIRWREAGGDHASTTFDWDIFLFGSDADASSDYNVSGLTADNEFSSPDGLFIDPRGVLWIQTDDGSSGIRSKTNNQMLVAIPGEYGDGESVTVTTADSDNQASIETFVGQPAEAVKLKRFLVGPNGCEITGISMTADARSMFINIQHPGEGGSKDSFNTNVSVWPAGSRDATAFGEGGNRPRSATIVIYREDGGEIAL
ncbi:PhoX family protein [Marinobacter halophilus]|uniref:PhoX family phosphatase n=2 Tax=Marinobacter halophilus TaxID=1323740 RepID=A0A2T1KCT7_9GAMM|nr:PhoX family phosphatase [Marinobacter halophilus]PSF07954.1 PhoX family phosphatase [Marinobacter halophilus]GGC58503.1 phosphatase [Marinobacter halophilus]